jgi:hypothetical protein
MKTIFLKRFLLSGFLCGLINLANAQNIVQLKESQGMPLRSKSYAEMKGNPYLTKSWSKAIVKQADGQVFKDIDVKYDQLEEQLIFKTASGQELGFAVPVTEFKISYEENGASTTKTFVNGFAPFRGSTDKTYYELLYDGSVKLLKKNIKQIESQRAYNSAVTTQTISERVKYYYALNNELVEFKRDAKFVNDAFGGKATAVQKYIKDNNLDLKKDEELIKAFAYFSTL